MYKTIDELKKAPAAAKEEPPRTYKIDPTVITEIWREREEHSRRFVVDVAPGPSGDVLEGLQKLMDALKGSQSEVKESNAALSLLASLINNLPTIRDLLAQLKKS